MLDAPSTPAPSLSPRERLARARALDEAICRLHQRQNQDEAAQACNLARMDETRDYLVLGFGSLQAYALDRLSMGSSKVRDLRRNMKLLANMPLVREAFFAGDLSWTKMDKVVRAVAKDPSREAYWLAQGLQKNSEDLGRAVSHRLGEKPCVWLRLEPEEAALFASAQSQLASEGHVLEPGAAVAELSRRSLQGRQGGSSAARAILTHDPSTGETTIATRSGEVPLRPETAARALCGAELQLPSGEVKRSIPTRVRNQVVARSKGRCEVPGCTNSLYLEVHHHRGWRAGHDLEHLSHLCGAHHKALHEGLLWIEGSWSTFVSFALADGTVLGTVSADGAVAPASRSPSRSDASPPRSEERARGVTGVACATPAESGGRASAPIPALPSAGASRVARATPAEGEHSTSGTSRRGAIAWGEAERVEIDAAVRALRSLEFKAREAKALVQRALERQPELSTDASALVHAALLLTPSPGRRRAS